MFNLEKASYCSEKLKSYFEENEENAKVLTPKGIKLGSIDYVLYIFFSCLLDYGMRSKVYHSNLVNTYNSHKEIFNPLYVVENYENNSDTLLEIIKNNIHPRYPNIAVKKWISLSKYINDNFPHDKLLQTITSIDSYSELYKFITNIDGYGQKTGGLLLRLIYESGICKIDEEMQDIPIDRHDIEISFLNGVIDKDKLNEKEIKELGEVWINSAKKFGINACYIDKYLWSIGNSFCLKKKCLECPLKENCKRKI